MHFTLNIPKLVAVLTATGGVVGVILGALNVGDLSGPLNDVITGIAGVLVLITSHHTTKAAMPATSTTTTA
jgi:hypothetical protein